jgi:hypothetical protein
MSVSEGWPSTSATARSAVRQICIERPTVSREDGRPEMPSDDDVQGVAPGQVVSERPGLGQKTLDVDSRHGQRHQPAERDTGFGVGHLALDHGQPPQGAERFDVQVLGRPEPDVHRQERFEPATVGGVHRDLDGGGRVDDDGCGQGVSSTRSARIAAAALRNSSSGLSPVLTDARARPGTLALPPADRPWRAGTR